MGYQPDIPGTKEYTVSIDRVLLQRKRWQMRGLRKFLKLESVLQRTSYLS